MSSGEATTRERSVHIPLGSVTLDGDLVIPPNAMGIVIFAHGSGSSRVSPRNRAVAAELQHGGFATLLFDLLTPEEERVDAVTMHLRFDIPLLASRLIMATDWVRAFPAKAELPIGYFGASTGAAAALVAASHRPQIRAVVSRGGRPDLAGRALDSVEAATLLIVGGFDEPVVDLNRDAYEALHHARERRLQIVPRATHLFQEPGALEHVSDLARQWFAEFVPEHVVA